MVQKCPVTGKELFHSASTANVTKAESCRKDHTHFLKVQIQHFFQYRWPNLYKIPDFFSLIPSVFQVLLTSGDTESTMAFQVCENESLNVTWRATYLHRAPEGPHPLQHHMFSTYLSFISAYCSHSATSAYAVVNSFHPTEDFNLSSCLFKTLFGHSCEVCCVHQK